MTKFSKETRQQIVRDFAIRHNGQYDPKLFLEEVRSTGETHPAWEWFEWGDDKAAQEYRLWQARSFVKDLRVTFAVEVIGRDAPVRVRSVEMPLVLSPVAGRNTGGGYILVDPGDPGHMREHCRQAADALEAWIRRYKAAAEFAGSVDAVEGQVSALRLASSEDAAA